MATELKPKTHDTLRAPRTAAPSDDAIRAFDQFDALRRYFRSEAQMARALGWKPNTVAAWGRRMVTRPTIEHRQGVQRLLVLLKRSAEWTVEDHLAGDWVLEAQAELKDHSPSVVLRVLKDKGLKTMMDKFTRIAPRTPVGEVDLPSAEDLEAGLRETLGGAALAMFDRAGEAPEVEVDLSDFDD
jgi:hypothetical protein